jgi:predicted MFS family arabinose efflux permease
MSILVLVPFGILSDRLGRKPMLVIPTILVIIGSTMRAFSTSPSHLLAASFVGALSSDFFTVLISMVSDVAEPKEQRVAISTLLLFSSVGMVMGPLIGSLLLSSPMICLRNLYQLDAVWQTCVLLYVVFRVSETRKKEATSESMELRAYVGDLLGRPSFRCLLAMSFLFFYFFASMNTYIPIFANRTLGFSDAEVSALDTFKGLAIMLTRFSAATFLNKVSATGFLMSILCLGGAAALMAPLANSYASLIVIVFLYGASFGATMILGYILVTSDSSPRSRGTANAIYGVFQSMGSLAVVLTSSMAEAVGLTPVFLIAGVAALSSAIPIYLRRSRTR